jgi:hypothetical protein
MAPGSQEASFLTVEEEAVPTTTVSKKYVSSSLTRKFSSIVTRKACR